MDLTKLRDHQDKVTKALEPMARIEHLITLNQLRVMYPYLDRDACAREIEKLYREELKAQ